MLRMFQENRYVPFVCLHVPIISQKSMQETSNNACFWGAQGTEVGARFTFLLNRAFVFFHIFASCVFMTYLK